MRILKRILGGLLVGSFVYLLLIYFNAPNRIVSRLDINNLFIISISAGLLTFIFDIEKLSYVVALILHYLSMNILVFILFFLNHGLILKNSPLLFLHIFQAYLLSWIVSTIRFKLNERELNSYLKR